MKQFYEISGRNITQVAPCAGAWIETTASWKPTRKTPVAPCAGAWIETMTKRQSGRLPMSPPARGRGLKHDGLAWMDIHRGRPLRGGVD